MTDCCIVSVTRMDTVLNFFNNRSITQPAVEQQPRIIYILSLMDFKASIPYQGVDNPFSTLRHDIRTYESIYYT